MKSKPCPICGQKIKIYYDNEVGDDLYCDYCEREFLLTSFNPIRLEAVDFFERSGDVYWEEEMY